MALRNFVSLNFRRYSVRGIRHYGNNAEDHVEWSERAWNERNEHMKTLLRESRKNVRAILKEKETSVKAILQEKEKSHNFHLDNVCIPISHTVSD